MKPPPRIAQAARARITKAAAQIRESFAAFADGRPGDAEPEAARRVQVYQVRTGSSLQDARREVAKPTEGQERIWGETVDFVDVAFFERGRRAARAVARIITKDGVALGTGFLISPRMLMTNNHVIGTAAESAGLVAEFDYQRDLNGSAMPVTRYTFDAARCFVTNGQDDLDYTVIALGERVTGPKTLAQFGYLPISNARNKHQLGDLVNIIQHPDGRPKEAVLRENQIVSRLGTVLHYVADTEPGSSGSPVFNVQFAVVALHHWGSPHRELTDEHGKTVPKTVNEGIRASAIYGDLATLRSGMTPLSREYIDEALRIGLKDTAPAATPSEPESSTWNAGAGHASPVARMSQDGTATWTIPVQVSVRVGDGRAASRIPETLVTQTGAGSPTQSEEGQGEAMLELDRNYDNRGGYDPNFLGGKAIPLPKLSAAQAKVAARNQQAASHDNPFELKYHHYSVLMNGLRRLAFVSAVNIDGATSKDFNRQAGIISDPFESAVNGEATELWFAEDRIREDEQTPRDFYQGQTTFDAHGNKVIDKRTGGVHINRMFQQGHLTRRQDPLWGHDDNLIRFANADTFHVTNCAPQVGFFNMGIAKRENIEGKAKTTKSTNKRTSAHAGGNLYWRALEEYVLSNARANRGRVCVFTGPVFDDENDCDWDRGRPDMKGFKAPREFWKLILRVENKALHATALVIDQSPLIDYLPEAVRRGEVIERLPYEKIAKYHASLAELESRTRLDFGKEVRAADTYVPTGRGEKRRLRKVEDISEVSLTKPRGRRDSARSSALVRKVVR